MSSLLEQFIVLFDSDADEVKKGADEAKKSTDKLNTELNTTARVSQRLGGSFKNLMAQAGGALLAIMSVGAIVGGIKAAATYADRLDELSKALGVNIEDLSAWGDAVKMTGGTAESFQETAKAMTAAIADFATKGKSRIAPFFKELGISMVDSRGKARNFIDVLPEIADAFQKISKQEAFGLGQKMGLDQGTIMLLQQGRREVDMLIARQKELGVVTKEEGEIAAKYNDQLDDTAHAFRSLFTTIGASVLPAMTSVLKMFERLAVFFRKHSDLIVGALIGIGAAIAYFVTPAIISMLVAFAPFLLIGAAIAGVIAIFALLYEDISAFSKGHKSLIGEMLNRWPIIGKVIEAVRENVKKLWDGLKQLGAGLLEDIQKGWENLLAFPDKIKSAWGKAINGIKSAWEFLKNLILDGVDSIVGAFDKIKSFFGSKNETTINAVNTGKQAMTMMSTSPIAAQTSNSILNSSSRNTNKSTTVNVGEITVNTQATNGQEVAGALSGNLQQQLRQATANFDDGVLA
jgi:hypothetical protein